MEKASVHNCSDLQDSLAADAASLLHRSGFPRAPACALVHQQRPRVPQSAARQLLRPAKEKGAYKTPQAVCINRLLFGNSRSSSSSAFNPNVASSLIPVKLIYKSASSEQWAEETLESGQTDFC